MRAHMTHVCMHEVCPHALMCVYFVFVVCVCVFNYFPLISTIVTSGKDFTPYLTEIIPSWCPMATVTVANGREASPTARCAWKRVWGFEKIGVRVSECTFIRACIRHYRGSTKIDWEQRQRASGKTASHTERYSAFAAASENVLMWRTLSSLSRESCSLFSLFR